MAKAKPDLGEWRWDSPKGESPNANSKKLVPSSTIGVKAHDGVSWLCTDCRRGCPSSSIRSGAEQFCLVVICECGVSQMGLNVGACLFCCAHRAAEGGGAGDDGDTGQERKRGDGGDGGCAELRGRRKVSAGTRMWVGPLWVKWWENAQGRCFEVPALSLQGGMDHHWTTW